MNKVPFVDSRPDPKEPEKSETLTIRPKATFQWPPDCVWPFTDQKWDSDT